MAVKTLALLAAVLGVAVGASVEPLRVNGLIAAVMTPLHRDGSLNLPVVREQALYLKATNISHVFVAGTTGESVSLTVPERLQLTEEWQRVGSESDIHLIVHIGAESINDVITLAKHAASHGAEALGIMPPVFFKPETIEALGAWLETAAGQAPDLPLYYYHIPSQTGVEFDMLDLLKEMDRRGVQNFAGVKYTGLYETRAFPDLMRCNVYKDGAYDILSGREEVMAEAMAVGTVGFIGSQFNFAGDIYWAVHNEQDVARRTQLQLAAIELLYLWLDTAPAATDGNKAMMELAGVPVGPPRAPKEPMPAQARLALRAQVKAWCEDPAMGGLFDTAPKICSGVAIASVGATA